MQMRAPTAAAPCGTDGPAGGRGALAAGTGSTTPKEQPPQQPPPPAAAPARAGPIVTGSLEVAAAAQQAVSLLSVYDYKLYGQGLSAGAQAVPLMTSPSEEVLYAPPPELPKPPAQKPAAAGPLAAAAAAAERPWERDAGTPPRAVLGAEAPAAAAPERRAPAGLLGRAAAWLLRAVWLLALALARLLVLAPAQALLGPWYRYNRRMKERRRALLAQQEFDLGELREALGALPSWLAGMGGSTERLDWLNTLLAQAWPVLDPIVCELVRATVEPLLDAMKPPFISAMGFQKLTLGELPVVLEGMRVVGGARQGVSGLQPAQGPGGRRGAAASSAAAADRLEMECDFHWVGQPNISFFVQLALAEQYTRMVPKVSHLTARGTLRLGLTRLVPTLPGFGAIIVSLARTPQVKFTLDFGPVLGGRFTAKPVAAFLDPFLRDTLANLVVWPNRFVVPLLPRSVTGNLDDLALHSVGVLQVEVLEARRLPKRGGPLTTVDPQVELWTQPQHRVHSSVKKASRSPKWRGQRLEVLVQEPDSQLLRVVLNDIDALNLKEVLRANLLQGAAGLLRSASPIGRAALPLRDVCAAPYRRQEVELRLSATDWAYELGVVEEEDSGSVLLALTYHPFRDLDAASAAPISCRGVLFVDVRQCVDLPVGDWDSGGSSDPYVVLKVAAQQQQTVVVPHTTQPEFNSHHEFFNVTAPDVLRVQVWDRDYLKPDDLLGELEVPVKAVLGWTLGGTRGWRDGWWRLAAGRGGRRHPAGRIEMKVQFRPYVTA